MFICADGLVGGKREGEIEPTFIARHFCDGISCSL